MACKMMRGETFGLDNPFFGQKHTEELKNKQSELAKKRKGELASNWQNGISNNPYSPEFNKKLKQAILERDNYTCQCPNCEHLSSRLVIHHIDYDKQNNNPKNLIILCNSCHGKTVGKNKRQYWINFYQNMLIGVI